MKSTTSKTKPAPAPVAVIPVSESANLNLTLFDEPVNNLRGSLIAYDTVKGKFMRLAHTHLMTNEPAAITLDKNGRRHSAEDLARHLAILTLFVAKVTALDAER